MKHNWEYKRLGDICNIYQPQTISTKQLVDNGEYDVFGANGIIGKYDKFNHEFPEILLTCRGATCGSINVSRPKSWINGNAMVVHSKNQNLTFDFLKYCLKKLDYSTIITGAAQPQITRQSLAPTIIPIPPREVQERIVAELDKINEVMEDCRELLRNLDALAQSLFYDTFGDPILNPKAWPIKKLGDLCDFIGGGTPSKSIPEYYTGNIPWATVRDMLTFKLSKTELCITEDAVKNSATNILPKGMIVISTHVGLGKICELMQDTAINQDLKGISFTDNSIDKKFFIYWYRSIANFVISKGRGATVKGVTLDFMRNLQIPVPPMELQEEFAARIEAIEAIKANVNEQLAELQTLLDSRMDYWFN